MHSFYCALLLHMVSIEASNNRWYIYLEWVSNKMGRKGLGSSYFVICLKKQKSSSLSPSLYWKKKEKKIRKEELVGKWSECWLPPGPLNPITMETPEGSRNDSRDSLAKPLKESAPEHKDELSLQPLKTVPLPPDWQPRMWMAGYREGALPFFQVLMTWGHFAHESKGQKMVLPWIGSCPTIGEILM